MVSQVGLGTGRIKQKLRTRKALVSAAWDLLRKGQQPTIEEVADKAMISRATAYRYFPNRERLLIEAVLSRESVSSENILARIDKNSPVERVARVQEYIYDLIIKHNPSLESDLKGFSPERLG